MSKNREIAKNIMDKAEEYGFELELRQGVLSVFKHFEKGNLQQFNDCCYKSGDILYLLPTSRPGSTWGSDGIGGQVALDRGHYERHKSGGNKLVLKALAQLLVKSA